MAKEYKYINVRSEELNKTRSNARKLLKQFYELDFDNSKGKREILGQLLGSMGENVHISERFHCEYGKNIFIGKDVIIGPNSTFIDNEKITIGSCVMLAPDVKIYTSYHPVLPEERYVQNREEDPFTYYRTCADPVEIKDGAWIGGNVTILPNVTIGVNSIIGAGSVVSRSIPDNCIAVGNPCKPIKYFDDIRKNNLK